MSKKRPVKQPIRRAQQSFTSTAAGQEESTTDVFVRFAAPLVEDVGDDYLMMQHSYQLAMLAWNFAVLPPHLRPREMAKLLKDIAAKESGMVLRPVLSWLVQQKDDAFAGYRWVIDRVDLEELGDEYQITVYAWEPLDVEAGEASGSNESGGDSPLPRGEDGNAETCQ